MQQMVSAAKFEALRLELINRFFVELHRGWFSLHEIVREIALQRLKQNPAAFRQAHGNAGEYFARPFKAKQMVGGELGAQFVEARYHLVQAQREQELNNIASRFGNYLKETFSGTAPIPQQQNELDERIAVLSALLVTPGPKSLEYYLARLLKHRGNPFDLKRALEHSRVATDTRDAWADRWLLRIQLEEQEHGIAEAINVARLGIAKVLREQGAPLYQICAELMAKAARDEEAIAILKDGIAKVPIEQSAPLYESCAELVAGLGHFEEAIELLKDGICKIPPKHMVYFVYLRCARLMVGTGRVSEAIKLLREGMHSIPIGESYRHTLCIMALRLCASCGDKETLDSLLMTTGKDALDKESLCLGNSIRFQLQQNWQQAAEYARRCRSEFPTDFSLATQEAFSWLCAREPEAADSALSRFPGQIQSGESNSSGWLLAFIALRNGKMAEARQYLADYLGRDLTDEDVNEVCLLRLWDTPVNPFTGAGPATFFPMLPPSLTGLAEPVTRQINSPPVLPDLLPKMGRQPMPAAMPGQEGSQTVLVIATEWESKYGGLW
jgi:tetratricopeptide (TPR) repeat protein